jgi:hypothetical protein
LNHFLPRITKTFNNKIILINVIKYKTSRGSKTPIRKDSKCWESDKKAMKPPRKFPKNFKIGWYPMMNIKKQASNVKINAEI